MYVLSRFALRLELILNRVELGAEFSAESNGTSFNGDYRSENLLIPQIVIFIGDFIGLMQKYPPIFFLFYVSSFY